MLLSRLSAHAKLFSDAVSAYEGYILPRRKGKVLLYQSDLIDENVTQCEMSTPSMGADGLG